MTLKLSFLFVCTFCLSFFCVCLTFVSVWLLCLSVFCVCLFCLSVCTDVLFEFHFFWNTARVGRSLENWPLRDKYSHFWRKICIWLYNVHVYSIKIVFSSSTGGNPETKFDNICIANFLFLTLDDIDTEKKLSISPNCFIALKSISLGQDFITYH